MKDSTSTPWGLVLGSGAAKGWAHVGVAAELEDMGLRPDVVSGCSMGALVGGVYTSGGLEELQENARDLNVASAFFHIFDLIPRRSGLVEGNQVRDFIRHHLQRRNFEHLLIPFACVATDLEKGEPVVLNSGDVLDAIRASISIPGMFSPVQLGDRILVDGGVTNPLPVDLARNMGAQKVIAVDLNGGHSSPSPTEPPMNFLEKIKDATRRKLKDDPDSWLRHVDERLRKLSPENLGWARSLLAPDPVPHLFEVMDQSLMIMENLITRQNLSRYPADVVLRPDVRDITIMEFHRAGEAMEAGRKAVRDQAETIRNLFKPPPTDRGENA